MFGCHPQPGLLMTNFITAERDQLMLLPPSIREWLPPNHLAVHVAEIVDRLDLSEIEQQYRGAGKDALKDENIDLNDPRKKIPQAFTTLTDEAVADLLAGLKSAVGK